MPTDALETDEHNQIISRGGADHVDPAPTEAYVGVEDWTADAMPQTPLESNTFEGMSPKEQLSSSASVMAIRANGVRVPPGTATLVPAD